MEISPFQRAHRTLEPLEYPPKFRAQQLQQLKQLIAEAKAEERQGRAKLVQALLNGNTYPRQGIPPAPLQARPGAAALPRKPPPGQQPGSGR